MYGFIRVEPVGAKLVYHSRGNRSNDVAIAYTVQNIVHYKVAYRLGFNSVLEFVQIFGVHGYHYGDAVLFRLV